MALARIKENLLKEHSELLSDVFKDPISQELLKDNFVITTSGVCFNRYESVAKFKEEKGEVIDPYTRLPIAGELLGDKIQLIKDIVLNVNRQWSQMEIKIKNMKKTEEEKIIQQEMQSFKEMVLKRSDQIEELIKPIREVDQIKQRLKIDIMRPQHLSFWERKPSLTNTILQKIGYLKEIKDTKGVQHIIPASVCTVIEAATKQCTSKDDFLENIKSSTNINQPKSSLFQLFRFKSTSEIRLLSEDLEKLDLRR